MDAVESGDAARVGRHLRDVFEFAESVALLPFYYQEWLRLREISGRLTAIGLAA